MSTFVDFGELKQRVSIEAAVKMLGLQMKPGTNQLRGPCPSCREGGDRALVITPAKAVYYCFADKKGGDVISLTAHILGLDVKKAAAELAKLAGLVQSDRTVPSTSSQRLQEPESERGQESARTFAPLTYLEADHPALDAVGFCPDFAKKHGIGFSPKGMMRGYVAIPFRDEHGTLLGYIGVQECKLPADFTPNVVSLEKRRA